MGKEKRSKGFALKIWRGFVVIWPLLCLVFAGIIIGQSDRTVDERVSDVGFTIFPLVFFAIGMSIRYRLLEERENATALTTAVVVSEGMRKRTGKNKVCFPVFEFQANGMTYRVTSRGGSGFNLVKNGRQVDLYYNPGDPQLFYVPILQKYHNRCSRLFCGIGILFPLTGLFAPQLRSLLSFLP